MKACAIMLNNRWVGESLVKTNIISPQPLHWTVYKVAEMHIFCAQYSSLMVICERNKDIHPSLIYIPPEMQKSSDLHELHKSKSFWKRCLILQKIHKM